MSAAHAPLPDDIDALKTLVLASRAEVEHLKLVIAKLQRLQFGRRSEKLDREIEQLVRNGVRCAFHDEACIRKARASGKTPIMTDDDGNLDWEITE